MRLQLHRSIIFWSGLLVMGFISWAWRDSLQERSVYTRSSHGSTRHWFASSAGGALTVAQARLWEPNRSAWGTFGVSAWRKWQRTPLDANSREQIQASLAGRLGGYRHVENELEIYSGRGPAMGFRGTFTFDAWTLSFQGLLLIHLALWSGLLFLRAQRLKRTGAQPDGDRSA